MSSPESLFHVRERGSNLGTEVRAGVTTFMAMTYVVWKVLTGRGREVRPFLWVVAALFLVVFALPVIQRALSAPAA